MTQAQESAVARFEAARRLVNRQSRPTRLLVSTIFLVCLVTSVVITEVSLHRLAIGLRSSLSFVGLTLPALHFDGLLSDLADWYWGLGRWLGLLFDTVIIAILGTLYGTLGAFSVCFLASRNLSPSPTVGFVIRRFFEVTRSVPDLVFALIFIYAFGLGPLPGVLAISLHSLGANGKLFTEVSENVEFRQVEAVRAVGGNWIQVVWYGVVPQILPDVVSYTLLRFELNVRTASVLGFVGAGGIGQELYTVVRQFIYLDISAIVLMIITTVALIDVVCERIRHHLIGGAVS